MQTMEESNMAEGVVESKEEMKKNMEKKKKEQKEDVIKTQPKHIETPTKTTDESDKTEEVKVKLTTAREDTKRKLTSAQEQTKQKLSSAQKETGEKLTTARKGAEEKLGGVKEGTKDTWGNVQDNIGDFRDEAAAKFEEYRKESEKEGRNPAEKFISDLLSGIKQTTEGANQVVKEKTRAIPINVPLTDVMESDTTITIISDIPGLEKENIDVEINQMTVEIIATYKEKQPLPSTNFIQKERGHGVVSRLIELPSPIDIEKTNANYKNCTLTIIMPKKEIDVTKITIQE